MRIVYRADASPLLGAGHVMRISALAETTIAKRIESVFIGNIQGIPWLSSRINSLGFSEIFSCEQNFKSNPQVDTLILDSYTLPLQSQFIHPSAWKKIVVISDPQTPKYSADLVIAPRIAKINNPEESPKILSGSKYFLIRKSIVKVSPSLRENGRVRILVTGGGTDPFDLASAMGKMIDKINTHLPIEVHFFANKTVKSEKNNLFITHKFGKNFDEVAQNSDLVLTTASTGSYEFIARELPLGIVLAVENQKQNFIDLIELGYAVSLGKFLLNKGWQINQLELKPLIERESVRLALIEKIRGKINFDGPAAILHEILAMQQS